MRKYRKLFFWLILGAALFMTAYYVFYRKHGGSEKPMEFTFNMESGEGRLGIQSKEITSQTLMQGVVCVNNAENVSKIDLFMPDMGHGSSPPVLSKSTVIPKTLSIESQQATDFGCFNISKMEMFMPGLWQVRVFYKSGELAYFNVPVKD